MTPRDSKESESRAAQMGGGVLWLQRGEKSTAVVLFSPVHDPSSSGFHAPLLSLFPVPSPEGQIPRAAHSLLFFSPIIFLPCSALSLPRTSWLCVWFVCGLQPRVPVFLCFFHPFFVFSCCKPPKSCELSPLFLPAHSLSLSSSNVPEFLHALERVPTRLSSPVLTPRPRLRAGSAASAAPLGTHGLELRQCQDPREVPRCRVYHRFPRRSCWQ